MKQINQPIQISILSVALMLAACGAEPTADNPAELKTDSISEHELARVCRNYYLPSAPEYSSDSSEIRPVYIYDKIKDDDKDFTLIAYHDIPDIETPIPTDWTLNHEQPENIQLVTCITRTQGEFFQTCEYDDGYSAEVYNAVYTMRLLSTKTGAEVATTTVQPEEECPLIVSFEEGVKNKTELIDIENESIRQFIEPYVKPNS